MDVAVRRDLSGQGKLKNRHKNICEVFLKDYNPSQEFFKKSMFNRRDVTYITIENDYFPMNMIGMATRNWRQKTHRRPYINAKLVVRRHIVRKSLAQIIMKAKQRYERQ